MSSSAAAAGSGGPSGDYTLERKRRPGLFEGLAHYFQILNLTHSWWNVFAWILKPFIRITTFWQGVRANKGAYIYRKRLIHGENFVCAGGVWLGGFEQVKSALVEPQARSFYLASSRLDPQHLPMTREGGRLNFLLALSQKGAGGKGDWEAFRAAVDDYVTGTEGVQARMKDETSQKLLEDLVLEYKGTKSRTFFTNDERGLLDFLLKYLHYVIFGIDPNDKDKIRKINRFHYDSQSATYHLQRIGNLFGVCFPKWPRMIKEVTKIYAESPALQNFEPDPKYNNMTRYELSGLMLSIMSLAGMVGPKTLAYVVLGYREFNPYQGEDTDKIDVTKVWDRLNLNDRDEVKRYVYECARLRNPVSNSHRVATEDFTCKIGRRDVTFRKGTIIFIPMIMTALNEKVWGPTTFQFDHNRPNLCPYATFFHSFGDETNGRICPGRHIAEELMIDTVIALGKFRQGGGSSPTNSKQQKMSSAVTH